MDNFGSKIFNFLDGIKPLCFYMHRNQLMFNITKQEQQKNIITLPIWCFVCSGQKATMKANDPGKTLPGILQIHYGLISNFLTVLCFDTLRLFKNHHKLFYVALVKNITHRAISQNVTYRKVFEPWQMPSFGSP